MKTVTIKQMFAFIYWADQNSWLNVGKNKWWHAMHHRKTNDQMYKLYLESNEQTTEP